MMDRKMNQTSSTRWAWRAMLWGGLVQLLLLPALAMQLGAHGVDWSVSDFVIMGVLLAAWGLAIEAAVRFLASWQSRLIAIGSVLIAFLLFWIELAVGLIGTPFSGS